MIEAWIITFTLILVRVATFCFVLPIFGPVTPPRMVKVGLAFGLTIFWLAQLDDVPPPVQQVMSVDLHVLSLAWLAIQEMLIGGMLGLAFHVFLIPARIAGAYLAQELGLSLASLSDPSSPEQTTVISTIFIMFGLLLFFILNLHHLVIHTLHLTFEKLPVASPFSWSASSQLAQSYAGLIGDGVALLGPVGILLFIILIVILLLGRAVPTFNLFSVGLPVRLLAGLLALFVFLPEILDNMLLSLRQGESLLAGFLKAL